ncbi:MAG: hypothetical protein A2252_06990 [Elusimicrobia bacterium RIFOXYA2_FULL_39_19]|nr:MAG: hypothetical protein A2252_06990 [Elusimicrobia bacterium RIFOXYA2_FULL_39_19]
MAENSNNERRRFDRVDVSGTVKITAPISISSNQGDFYGILVNISIGGMGVELNEKLQLQSIHVFSFTLNHKYEIKLKGQVKWFLQKDKAYLHGIEFTKIGFFTKLKLKKYLNESLSS